MRDALPPPFGEGAPNVGVYCYAHAQHEEILLEPRESERFAQSDDRGRSLHVGFTSTQICIDVANGGGGAVGKKLNHTAYRDSGVPLVGLRPACRHGTVTLGAV
jgi:hypothetical protein